MEVLEINRVEQLRDFREIWQRLWERTAAANFFQSLGWLQTYWRHFGAGQKLRVLIVKENDSVCGILPLVVSREQTRLGKVRVLTYPLHDWGSFYGPIGPDPEGTLRAGLQHIRNTQRDWDLLELRWTGWNPADCQSTYRAMRSAGFQARRSIWDRTYFVELQGTWDEYFQSHSSKWRNNFRRWERRLHQRGTVRYCRYRPRGETFGDADPRWDLYEMCEEVARRSWQGSSTTGTTLTHESVRPFLRDVHAVAARVGAVDMNLLLLDDRPVAFAYNYHCRGYVYGLRIGYDAAASRDGVGNLLYAQIIRDSFERNDHTYDLGVGSLSSKRYILTRTVPIYRYCHYPLLSPRAQLIRCKRWASEQLFPAAIEPALPATNKAAGNA